MQRLIITPEKDKGRSFEGMALAWVTADTLWPGGLSDNVRPVWAMFAGSTEEMRAFIANLQLGRKAEMHTVGEPYSNHKAPKMEFLKSAGYQWTWQRTPEMSIVTAFFPDMFRLDPGMVDPKQVSFCLLPSAEWILSQVPFDSKAIVDHLKGIGCVDIPEGIETIAPVASLFCAYLDRRTRCPLVNDERFYVQLYLAALGKGIASFSTDEEDNRSWRDPKWGRHLRFRFHENHTRKVGLLPGVVCQCNHEQLEALLAEQVALFFDASKQLELPLTGS